MTTVTWLERDRWSTLPPRPLSHGAVAPGPGALPRTRPAIPATPVSRSAPRFERHGTELVLVVAITADEATHGALIAVPAPGTTVRLRVPPGTASGHRFRVPRFHAPAPDGFGDLTIVVEVSG